MINLYQKIYLVILNFIINWYLKIWNKANNFLLIFSYIMLFIAVLVSKIALYIIINYNNL